MDLLQKGRGNYKGNLFLQVAGHFLSEVPLKSTENQLAILVFLAYVFYAIEHQINVTLEVSQSHSNTVLPH